MPRCWETGCLNSVVGQPFEVSGSNCRQRSELDHRIPFDVSPLQRLTVKSYDDDSYVVEVEDMDVYDPVGNEVHPMDRGRIAAWFLDTDYDGRTFCICQDFFPDLDQWHKLARALKNIGSIGSGAFEELSGFRSLPFARPQVRGKGEIWRVAVKMIDLRGNEGLRVLDMGEE